MSEQPDNSNKYFRIMVCPNCSCIVGKCILVQGRFADVVIGNLRLTEFRGKCKKCDYEWTWKVQRAN